MSEYQTHVHTRLRRLAENASLQRIAWWLLGPFYPKGRAFNPFEMLATVFVPQKILRINGAIPWPVHPTSRVLYWRNITVGVGTAPGYSPGGYIQARNGIIVGDNFRLGPYVGLISANHDPDDYERHLPAPPIRIGNNVWLGMHVVVLPGVQIGDNVIIGAGAVVTGDVPSNVIAAGNPCRVIRTKQPYAGSSNCRA